MGKITINDIFKKSAGIAGLINDFSVMRDAERLNFIHTWSEKNGLNPAIASSFGIQSILLLSRANSLSVSNLPVVSVDIPGAKYDRQRQYRDLIAEKLNLNLLVFQADSFEDKVASMDRGLAENGISVVIHGVRASQTTNRQNKSLIEFNGRNNTVEFFPLLDWSDSKADYYIRTFPESLRHPDFGKTVKMQGGAIVEEKTECGLHLGT